MIERRKYMEIWKDIKGYEGYYQVSNMGDVRSLDRLVTRSDGVVSPKKGGILVKIENNDGYYQIKLCKNGINKTNRVHRIVLETFDPTDKDGMEVNHIDCNRKNNKLENLEWKTHLENVRHSSDQGKYRRYGKNNSNYGNTKLKEKYAENPELALEVLARPGEQNGRAKKVILYDMKKNEIAEFNWIGACAEYLIENNVTTSTVSSLRGRISKCSKENRPYKGHYFEIVA